MKKVKYILFFLAGLVAATGLIASIVNTKHNLSITGTGTAKATTETEVCVFCHIPHFAQEVGKPLWNRSMPTTDYVMYDSDYLRRMGYPSIAADLGSANDTPGALSRQCLSCHDGTIAVGAVSKLRRQHDPAAIDMVGVDLDGTIVDTSTAFIGTDLTHHHPVGAVYDPLIGKAFDVGTRTSELKPIPDSPIKLFEYAGYSGKYVECSSCHDPHKDNSKFLHFDTGANHAANFVGTCTSCHDKTSWVDSIHKNAPATAVYSDPAVALRYGTNKVVDLGCANCHVPHNGDGVGYLNRQVLAGTCFKGASTYPDGTNETSCHGTGGAKPIEPVLSRTYVHPVIASSDPLAPAHTNLDGLYGTGDPDPLNIKGMSWSNNKHAVCMDCHNPHRAQAGTHVVDGSWYGPSGGTNLVSNVLKGVTGIEPTWPTSWIQPTTFTTMESAEKEYQICFKCHSYWGIGAATWGINSGGYMSPSVPTQPLTDVAWEMNKNNRSGHPVVFPNSLAGRPGSYDPQYLNAQQLLAPWNAAAGASTMYCSDCHGADNELRTFPYDPKGPHGSNLKFILKGINQYWPTKSDNVTLYTMDDIKNGTDAGVFCKNCHDITYPHTQWSNNMSGKGYSCVQCHVAIPHGSPVSRLIGYSNFPAPYNYLGNSLAITGGWKKRPYSLLDFGLESAAYTTHAGMGCHGTNAGGYDTLPVLP